MNKLILLLAVVLSTSLFSCDKNDEPTAPVTATITYSMGDMGDLIDMVDVSVEYTGADGKTVTESIQSKTWEKVLKGVKTPFLAKAKITYVRKANFTPEDKMYIVSKGMTASYTTTSKGFGTTGSISISEMSGIEQVNNYLAQIDKKPTFAVSLDIPGK